MGYECVKYIKLHFMSRTDLLVYPHEWTQIGRQVCTVLAIPLSTLFQLLCARFISVTE
jgi:hypothetical protein